MPIASMMGKNKQSNSKAFREFLEKVVINAGVGRMSQLPQFEEKVLPEVLRDLALISGQKPATRPARKSIAGFKIREGQIVGLTITLRRKRMEDFMKRLTNIVFPRVKDFRGLDQKIIDKGGVLNIGFRDQYVFPEIDPEESLRSFALQVTVVPKKRERAKAIAIYREMGVPLKANKNEKI